MGDRPLLRSASLIVKKKFSILNRWAKNFSGSILGIQPITSFWYEKKKKIFWYPVPICMKMYPNYVLFHFTLNFRLLRLCFTIFNLREDEGENQKQLC